jgi:hypothetical protein
MNKLMVIFAGVVFGGFIGGEITPLGAIIGALAGGLTAWYL